MSDFLCFSLGRYNMRKGFYVKCVVVNNGLKLGEYAYVKASSFKFSTSTGFDILNQKTGKTISYITANDLKNWFET
jgi:hypothetical protein